MFLWITFCKLFTVSKPLNWSNSKTIQILYDKNKRQIILLRLPRATGKFLKLERVKRMGRTLIFPLCALWPWPLSHHDTPLSHGYQLCETLSIANIRELLPEQWLYMCSVTLTLEIRHWLKVMTHPLIMDKRSVN